MAHAARVCSFLGSNSTESLKLTLLVNQMDNSDQKQFFGPYLQLSYQNLSNNSHKTSEDGSIYQMVNFLVSYSTDIVSKSANKGPKTLLE